MTDQIKYRNKLQDKRVLVIGGSSGIGFSVAEAALEHGSVVYIASSKQERVNDAVERLQKAYPSAKGRISGHAIDLKDEAQLEANLVGLFDWTGGSLDHVVFTAGDNVPYRSVTDISLDLIKDAAAVRYVGPVFVAKVAPRYLNPGPASSLTLTTGFATEKPISGWSGIIGPRAAIAGLTKSAAFDLRPLRVNAVCVGAVDTEHWSGVSADQKEKLFELLKSKTTTGCVAKPEDAAEAYLYCMRDGNVSGTLIHTSGGGLIM